MLPPNLYAVCALSVRNCTRDRGCGAHPVFPAPSQSSRRANDRCKPRADRAARTRSHVPVVIPATGSADAARRQAPAGIEYSRGRRDGVEMPRRTGSPPSRIGAKLACSAESSVIPAWNETRIAFERRLVEHCRAAWRSGKAQCYGAGDEGVLASARDHQCGGFAAADPGLLSGRRGPAIDSGMGDVGRPCRYLQCGAAVSLASVRGLAGAAGGSGACGRRAEGEPRPDDPYH